MTKRKRTLEQVEAMQQKAIRFQEALWHDDAAWKLERLTPDEYAKLRNIEIIDEPVRKTKRRTQAVKKRSSDEMPPPVMSAAW